jgi:2-oxoisovalerate dehydrogenase E1 component
MSKFTKIRPEAECCRYETTEKDFLTIPKVTLAKILFYLYSVREFESALLDLQEKGLVHGPVHSSIGQEAVAAGIAASLSKKDYVGSTHRAHGHFLTKALAYYAPDNYDPTKDPLTSEMQMTFDRTLAEIMGLKSGWCGGRGGSMHLYDKTSGNLGSNAIVGGGIPLATGAAWAESLRKGKGIVVSIFGDGAINQGCFHEVANMAILWNLPIIYLLENNNYAVATCVGESCGCTPLAMRSVGYGISSLITDGMDPLAVFLSMNEIISRIRKKQGPAFLEVETYRYPHHSGSLPGHLFGYRDKAEEAEWKKRDPIVLFPSTLIDAGIITDDENVMILEKAKNAVQVSVDAVTYIQNGKLIIPIENWPASEDLGKNLRSDSDEFNDVQYKEKEEFADFKTVPFVDAIASVTLRNMQRDERIFVLGLEVAHLRGGSHGATRGILEAFPERIFNTPISEAGFVGMSGGAASQGLRPVVELMFPDFALVAGDQLFNQISKLKHMYGGNASFPMVVRSRVAIGSGFGGQHCMNPVGLFNLFQGWRILAPSNAFDYIGMFNTAVRFNDPVLMIEHMNLYKQEEQIPTDSLDYYIPYGNAKVVRDGTDLTVLTYLTGVPDCLAAAKLNNDFSIEVIDLRTLDYSGIDYSAIGNSVRKTGRVLIVEQVPRSQGIGARLSDEIQERFFSYLRSPVAKLSAAADVPPPVSKALESFMIPSVERIHKAMQEALSKQIHAKIDRAEAVFNKATPLARNIAERNGICINDIQGTGPRGKIYTKDLVHVKTSSGTNVPTYSGPTAYRSDQNFSTINISNIRKAVGQRITESAFTAPHIYFFADVDMDPLLRFKKELANGSDESQGAIISINDLLIKATALVLRKHSLLNASIDGETIKVWRDINIGLAVALKDGLIVPAIPRADQKRFSEIAQNRKDLVERAHAGTLKLDEIQSGTFTISSLARYSITHFTAIINPPQSAILSVGPTHDKAIVTNGTIRVGKCAVFGLSVDHRIADGVNAAEFLTDLKDFLENMPQRLLLMQ